MLTVLEKKIYDFISSLGSGVSCVELFNEFGKGESCFQNKDNVITSFGMSEELADSLSNLIGYGLIVGLPVPVECYLLDGAVLPYPQQKGKVPKEGYKTPHWLAIGYYTYQQADKHIRERTDYSEKKKQEALKLLHGNRFEALKNYDNEHAEDWREDFKKEILMGKQQNKEA